MVRSRGDGGGGVSALSSSGPQPTQDITVPAWGKKSVDVVLAAPPDGERAYLIQAVAKIHEDVRDTALTWSGQVWCEIILSRSAGDQLLAEGALNNGFGPGRSPVGAVGTINYTTNDKLVVNFRNESGADAAVDIDHDTISMLEEIRVATTWTQLGNNKPWDQIGRVQGMKGGEDPGDLRLTPDHGLCVREMPWWAQYPGGRVMLQEDFESGLAPAVKFAPIGDAGGSNAIGNGTTDPAHSGKLGVKVSTVAGAGKYWGMKVGLPLCTDQQGRALPAYDGALYWFTPWGNTHWRDFQLIAEIDDGIQGWKAGMRVWRKEAGAARNKVQYWGDGVAHAGAWVDAITTPVIVDDDYILHMMAFLLAYQQGDAATVGYLKYNSLRVDDYRKDLAAAAANQVATSGVQKAYYSIILTDDDATAAVGYIDDVLIWDGAPSLGV